MHQSLRFPGPRALLLAGAALGASSFALSAVAAPVEKAGEAAAQVEEVIVTARKREERLQDVPLAVTAVSGASLEKLNITQAADLQRVSPSLQISPATTAGRSVPLFSIRGQSQQEQVILADPSVAVYFGDIVAARVQGVNQTLVDIGSVEVLKGPQGTLFGRNTTGGAILIKPNRPTENLEGSLAATVGNLGVRKTEAVLNVPLGDKASLRLAGGTETGDGWIYDTILERNINFVDNWMFRASLLLRPTDNIESLFVYNRFEEDDGGAGSFIAHINPNGVFNSALARAARNYPTLEEMLAQQQARGIYETASGTPQTAQVRTWDLANTTTWRISDSISLKNIVGWRQVDDHLVVDTDGLPIPLLELEKVTTADQFTEEFQVLGNTGALNWIVGAYYFNETGENGGPSITGQPDPGALQPSDLFQYPAWSITNVEGHNKSFAIFAQGTLSLDRFVHGLSATVGLRNTWDERNVVVKNRNQSTCRFTLDTDNNPATPEVNPGLAGCSLPLETSFSEPTYNLSLEWKADPDTLLYIANRRGYRSGGFAARASTEAGLRRTFEPEFLGDTEIGVKRDWRFGDAFLRTNLALYWDSYTNLQRQLVDPTTIPITTVAVNAANASVKGAELEVLFRPNQYLEFSGFYSYTDAHFVDYTAPDGRDLTNTPFSRAPTNIYSISARGYFPPLPSNLGNVSVGATLYHTDSYFAQDDVPNDQFRSTFEFPGYSLVHLDAEWSNVADAGVDISVFVDNAADKEIVAPMLNVIQTLGFDARTPLAPRTIGVRLKYSFGR